MSIEKLKQDAQKITNDYKSKQRAQSETERHNKVSEKQKDKEIKAKKAAASKKPNK